MNILAMETTGKVASVAVMAGGKLKYEAYCDCGLTHSKTIIPLGEQALETAGLAVSDIDVIGVTVGPGSFTGVRIGVAAAKGLMRACGAKAAAINALDALAANAAFGGKIVCPMMDARNNQVYTAIYDGTGERISEYMACGVDEVLERIDGDAVFLGDGAVAYADRIRAACPDAVFAPAHLMMQRASAVAALAYAMAKAGELSDEYGLVPLYLRKPQAERERDRKEGRAT